MKKSTIIFRKYIIILIDFLCLIIYRFSMFLYWLQGKINSSKTMEMMTATYWLVEPSDSENKSDNDEE